MRKILIRVSLATVALFAVSSVGLAGGKAEKTNKPEKHVKAEKGETGKKAQKEKPTAPATATLSGSVRVSKDENTGAVKGISILAADGFEYQVKTSSEAKALETMDGQDVEVTGKVTEKKGGEKWLQVKEVKTSAKVAPADGAKAIDKAL